MKFHILSVAVVALIAVPAVGCDAGSSEATTQEAALTIDLATAVQVGHRAEIRVPVLLTLDPEFIRSRLAIPAGGVGAANPDWSRNHGANPRPVVRVDAEVASVDVKGGRSDGQLVAAGLAVTLVPGATDWQREAAARSDIAQGPLHTLIQPLGVCGSSDTQECVISYELVVRFDPTLMDSVGELLATVQATVDTPEGMALDAPLAVAFE
jgi:hypothetical protein